MGEGLHLCGIHIAIDIEALGLLRENHRYMKVVRYDTCNADAGSFDGENLIDRLPFETAFELLAHLIKEIDIHLMIQETVNLQDVSFLHDPVFCDTLF